MIHHIQIFDKLGFISLFPKNTRTTWKYSLKICINLNWSFSFCSWLQCLKYWVWNDSHIFKKRFQFSYALQQPLIEKKKKFLLQYKTWANFMRIKIFWYYLDYSNCKTLHTIDSLSLSIYIYICFHQDGIHQFELEKVGVKGWSIK